MALEKLIIGVGSFLISGAVLSYVAYRISKYSNKILFNTPIKKYKDIDLRLKSRETIDVNEVEIKSDHSLDEYITRQKI